MNHISLFFNNQIINNSIIPDKTSKFLAQSVDFGNWCLTPIRYLCEGNLVIVSTKFSSVRHDPAYTKEERQKMPFLHVVACIILLAPSLIVGTIFKGIGYLSAPIREKHKLALLHFTPIDLKIGQSDERLSFEEIQKSLKQAKEANQLDQPVNKLTIYAEENTSIDRDPGIIPLNPDKVILVGAKITRTYNDLSSSLHDELVKKGKVLHTEY